MSSEYQNNDIRTRAIVVRFSTRAWSAKKIDKRESAAVAHNHHTTADKAGRYVKNLIAPELVKAVQKVITRGKAYHNTHTAPWDDNGGRLVLASNYMGYCAEMNKIRADFDAQVDRLIDSYDLAKAQAMRDLNGMYNPDDYLPVDLLRRKFGWSIDIEPVPGSADFRIDLPAAALAEQMAEIDDRVTRKVAAATREVRRDVQAAVLRVVDSLKKYNPSESGAARGVFRDTMITNLQDIVETLPYRNVTGDPALVTAGAQIAANLATIDPEVLRNDATARRDAIGKAQSILDNMAGIYGAPAAPANAA